MAICPYGWPTAESYCTDRPREVVHLWFIYLWFIHLWFIHLWFIHEIPSQPAVRHDFSLSHTQTLHTHSHTTHTHTHTHFLSLSLSHSLSLSIASSSTAPAPGIAGERVGPGTIPGTGTAYHPTALPTVGPYALPVPGFVPGLLSGREKGLPPAGKRAGGDKGVSCIRGSGKWLSSFRESLVHVSSFGETVGGDDGCSSVRHHCVASVISRLMSEVPLYM